jgi:arabinan endo-1,5-alpha-L-arabinosidase
MKSSHVSDGSPSPARCDGATARRVGREKAGVRVFGRRFRSEKVRVHLVLALPLLLGLLTSDLAGAAVPGAVPAAGGREARVHDPSTIAKCKETYWLFATGNGIPSRHSRDLVKWESGPRVFARPPAWTTNVVPNHTGDFWAPDVIQLSNRFLLYYSVSTWGRKTSAIGLATNPTLDPADPTYAWTDAGLVVRSGERDNFNAIDPNVVQDAQGNLWLTFGSFWSGIKLVQLDPRTGLRLASNSPIYSLAWNSSIEAPCLCRHGDFYYLFVNWGLCCRGVNSTYNIRVGRSPAITGPYLDKDANDMLTGGGSLFLDAVGTAIGPGHAGIFTENGTNWLSYHFYDSTRRGLPTLAIRPLRWGADGWPLLEK